MASSRDYLPNREAELVDWARNFETWIAMSGTAVGLTSGQIATFTGLNSAWVSAYSTAENQSTRTRPAIQAKNLAKQNLVRGPGGIRELAGVAQKNPSTTNAQRSAMGITVPDDERTPVNPPDFGPEIDMEPPVLRRVKVKLHNKKLLGRQGKPENVAGAAIFSYVGPTPPGPQTLGAWTFQTNTSRTSLTLEFPDTVPAGSTIWVTAFWFTQRGLSGPCSAPVYTVLPGSLGESAAA